MSTNPALRDHVVYLLKAGGAHTDFDSAVSEFRANLLGVRAPGSPHSAWELLEHMRIAQWDILEFVRDPKHVSPEFPGGYWPKTPAPSNDEAWRHSVEAFRSDLGALIEMAQNAPDLFATVPHGEGQTILRELLLAADHNAYHLGQLVLVRRLLGAWQG
ncbi:MAG TPA: DinB family protein [Bryobacteraceae bacterium]|jgi:hypothetical protein|nr:DinB family protein [Bryobacteraceae bacterium]